MHSKKSKTNFSGESNCKFSTSGDGEEVVITGIAGNFPDCDDVGDLRNNLFNKIDMISGDDRRWKTIHSNVPQRFGKLNDILSFDAGFFGFRRRHANNIDPQLRLLLERTFEAIVDAGYNPSELKGTKTGVFLAICVCESQSLLYEKQEVNADAILGNTHSMLAHYISYFFELQGPSYVMDAACCSSMYALEHAYSSMKSGSCDMAIVASATLCLHPGLSQHFLRLGVLSADGSCKTFCEGSDGYVRSETVCAFLLQKSNHARRSYSQIVHCKLNHGGYTEQGITFPSSESQAVLLKETYDECGLPVTKLGFFEAHGSATRVGDQEELNSIAKVFCSKRTNPLYTGSIKSNMGHSEAASAMTSVLKVIFAMETGHIPPNLNYTTPREGVEALVNGKLMVVTEKTSWPDEYGLAGINSFGFGGSKGHVVLHWNEKRKINSGLPEDDLPRIICASGRTLQAVDDIWTALRSQTLDVEFVKLFHAIFSKEFPDHRFRGYQILSKTGEIKRSIQGVPLGKKKLLWLLSNFDAKWQAVAKSPLAFPIFQENFRKIQDTLHVHVNSMEFIKNSGVEDEVRHTASTMAVQICMVETLKALGLTPDFIVGLGTGELTAAYLEGHLSLSEVVSANLFVAISLGDKRKIITKRNACFSKWLPLRTHHLQQGSAEYFYENIKSPIKFCEAQEAVPEDVEILVIGAKPDYFDGRRWDSEDCTVDFLGALGRLYEKGHELQLDLLYPKIAWPVSRGTPSISPLITWNHNQNWYVVSYEGKSKFKSGHHYVSINLKDEGWSYLTGHVVDGQNTFPISGYLSVVWESLAMMASRQQAQMKVAFENVKVFKTLCLADKSELKLTVSILRESGRFEITDNDAVIIITGTICELDETQQEFHALDATKSNGIVLTQEDIYKEFRIRGCDYKGAFKALAKWYVDEGKALIAWEENWVTFVEAMLQYVLLQVNTRNLYAPLGIEQVIIDAPKHMSMVEESNRHEITLPVEINHQTEVVSCGGVTLRGLKLTPVAKRSFCVPDLTTHKFIPNTASLSLEHSVMVMMQLVVENNNADSIKSVEVASADELLSPYIRDVLNNMAKVKPSPTVLSKTPIDLDGIAVDDKELGKTKSHVAIVCNIFEEVGLLEAALRAVEDANGYILTREKLNFDSSAIRQEGLSVLCVHKIRDECLILLQKQSGCKPAVFIEASDDLRWLPTAQKILHHQRLILYSQNNPTSGILGLVNCLRREPFRQDTSCFLILDEAPGFDPSHPFYKSQLQKDLVFNVWKSGAWGTYRHLPLGVSLKTQLEYCIADVTLSNIGYVEGRRPQDKAEDQMILVHYAAVNYSDVMLRSGKITVDAIAAKHEFAAGFEFSGRDASGKQVMGLSRSGALATHVSADALLTWEIPEGWSLEDAATVPAVYSLVIYALIMRSNMKRGQSVLVNVGPGGFGEAIINVALHFNCAIFVAVEGHKERDRLQKVYPQIKNNIGNCCDASFVDMVYLRTSGRGVDVILDSRREVRDASLPHCLAPNGQFVQIGTSNADTLKFKGASFHSVTLDMILQAKFEIKQQLSRYIAHFIQKGIIKPLPRIVFERSKITDAFNEKSSVQKILVKMRTEELTEELFEGSPRYWCDFESTHVILGGLGGFGLQLANWLVSKGARKIILSTRSGIKNSYQSRMIKLWQSSGVVVAIRKDDVTTEEGCVGLIAFANSLGSVRAVFNLSMVLKDGLFENQTIESFQMVLGSKPIATQHLDFVTRKLCPHLKHFVVFSSAISQVGNSGQTNYGMANSAIERICEQRKAMGFPALAIQWGCIDDVGALIAEQNPDLKHVICGIMQQKILSCLEVLDVFLMQDETIVSSVVIAKKFAATRNAGSIVDTVQDILAISDLKKISVHSTFAELGLDSIKNSELRQILEKDYEVILSKKELRTMTFAKLQEIAKQNLGI